MLSGRAEEEKKKRKNQVTILYTLGREGASSVLWGGVGAVVVVGLRAAGGAEQGRAVRGASTVGAGQGAVAGRALRGGQAAGETEKNTLRGGQAAGEAEKKKNRHRLFRDK